ncbi:MAG: TIGR01777 family oxidoreductase [Ferruginibacter sp.]
MKTVLITGGTGLVGSELTKHLTGKGYTVIILTRKMPDSDNDHPDIQYALWDVTKQTLDIAAVQKADYIVHLAGAGVVDKKWTEKYKKEILNSRTKSSELLVNTLKNNSNKVQAVVSASAIGWYGADPATVEKGFVETDKNDGGFLGETCQLWEESVQGMELLGKRLVKLRTGIVLSNDGGALVEFKNPLKFGIAGIIGGGKQMVSWIHIDDLCRIFIEAITNENLHGVYNAVAPNPVSNKKLTLQLATSLRGKFYIPLHVPEFVLKIMLGKRSVEVLKSTTVSCEKIKNTGFTFLYPSIEAALLQLAKK